MSRQPPSMQQPQRSASDVEEAARITARSTTRAARITARSAIVAAIITAILAPIIIRNLNSTTSYTQTTDNTTTSSSISTPPPSNPSVLILNSTYAGNTIAANGVQIPMNLYIDNETSDGALSVRVFYQTYPATPEYTGTGAIGANGHLTLTCQNSVYQLFLEGSVLSDGSIQGTDSIGGRWHIW